MTLAGTLGFEIECAVNHDTYSKFVDLCNKYKFDVGTDGSVHSVEGSVREIRSPVYTIEPHFLAKIKRQLKALSKHFVDINNTMGFHIHMRFNNIGIQQKLCEYETVKEFVDLYSKTFTTPEEKMRITGQYGGFNYTKEQWLNAKYADKYIAINAKHAYIEHKTVEFRIFPMQKDYEKIVEYIKFALAFVEKTQNDLEQNPVGFELNRKALVFKENKEKIELEVENEIKKKEGEELNCPFCGRNYENHEQTHQTGVW